MTLLRHVAGLGALLVVAGCAASPPDGAPTTAREAQAQFDALCATRPSRAAMESALRGISGDQAIEVVGARDFQRLIPWYLRPPPPGTANALRGGGKRWGSGGVPVFSGSFVAAAVFLDADDRVRGCRSSVLHDGP